MSVDRIWQRRFESLDARIAILSGRIKTEPAVDRQATLQVLADGLRGFADKMFNHFFKGFGQTATLEISSEYPVDHVLTKVLEQISYDLEAIEWAFEQRLHADAHMQWALQVGDKLAWEALQPAQDAFSLKQDTTALVYFQKFPEVRVIPYASVALIGLPITCVPKKEDELVARDFLAIPHEVAHYVYWHGRTKEAEEADSRPLYEAIAAEIAPQMAWGREWLEELFADVYGALIAGPLIAQSFQDLQMRVSQDRFLTDDGEHPSPFIRPDIYTKVMRKRGWEAWIYALNQRWKAKRNTRLSAQNPSPKIRYGRTGAKKEPTAMISLVDSYDNHSPDIKQQGDTPIDIAIHELLKLMPNLNSVSWQEPIALAEEGHGAVQQGSVTDVDKLYPALETWVRDLLNQAGAAGVPSNNPSKVEEPALGEMVTKWESAGRDKARQKAVQDALRAGNPINTAEAEANAPVPPSVWLTVLHAGGWGTKGPETNPVGG